MPGALGRPDQAEAQVAIAVGIERLDGVVHHGAIPRQTTAGTRSGGREFPMGSCRCLRRGLASPSLATATTATRSPRLSRRWRSSGPSPPRPAIHAPLVRVRQLVSVGSRALRRRPRVPRPPWCHRPELDQTTAKSSGDGSRSACRRARRALAGARPRHHLRLIGSPFGCSRAGCIRRSPSPEHRAVQLPGVAERPASPSGSETWTAARIGRPGISSRGVIAPAR